MLIRYMFKARATHAPFTYHDLEILRSGLAYNAAHNICSFVLRSDRQYFQVLEGPEAAVCALAKTIARDPRCFAFEELMCHSIRERQFDHSPMEFHMLGSEDRELLKRLNLLTPDTPQALTLSVTREVAALAHGKVAAVA